MAVGVGSANSILLVTFAREQQLVGRAAHDAAISAGHTRIRPVLMAAATMIVGMFPMALGGPGGEENAALARAVIGGLLSAIWWILRPMVDLADGSKVRRRCHKTS
jgi:multidrug efflux pump subunit AcrB